MIGHARRCVADMHNGRARRAASGCNRGCARCLRLVPRLRRKRCERESARQRPVGKDHLCERDTRRDDGRGTMQRGKTILALASVPGERGVMAARAVGRTDDCKRVKAEMGCGHDAREQRLQRNRIGRNQRCGFPDQPSNWPSHGGIIITPCRATCPFAGPRYSSGSVVNSSG